MFKFFLTTLAQGGKRFKGGSRPPEDASLSLNPKGKQQNFGINAAANATDERSKKAVEEDHRWQRLVLNDLENIPIGLIVAWSSLLSAYSPFLHAILVIAFAVGRVAHSYTYAKALQPHRAIFYFVGLLSTIGMALNGGLGVLAN